MHACRQTNRKKQKRFLRLTSMLTMRVFTVLFSFSACVWREKHKIMKRPFILHSKISLINVLVYPSQTFLIMHKRSGVVPRRHECSLTKVLFLSTSTEDLWFSVIMVHSNKLHYTKLQLCFIQIQYNYNIVLRFTLNRISEIYGYTRISTKEMKHMQWESKATFERY